MKTNFHLFFLSIEHNSFFNNNKKKIKTAHKKLTRNGREELRTYKIWRINSDYLINESKACKTKATKTRWENQIKKVKQKNMKWKYCFVMLNKYYQAELFVHIERHQTNRPENKENEQRKKINHERRWTKALMIKVHAKRAKMPTIFIVAGSETETETEREKERESESGMNILWGFFTQFEHKRKMANGKTTIPFCMYVWMCVQHSEMPKLHKN